MNIAEFLLARIAEEEAAARAARGPHWEHAPGSGDVREVGGRSLMDYADMAEADAAHIARHDPARILAQCAAMRKIVERHEPYLIEWFPGNVYCSTCCHEQCFGGDVPHATQHCLDRDALASIWSDHPDHRQEWSG